MPSRERLDSVAAESRYMFWDRRRHAPEGDIPPWQTGIINRRNVGRSVKPLPGRDRIGPNLAGAPRGRKTANQVGASKSASPCSALLSTGQIWQGRVYSRPWERDFVVVSFFEGETDGFETN